MVSAHLHAPQNQCVSAMEMHREGCNEDAAMAVVQKSSALSAVMSSLRQWPNSTEEVVKFTLCTFCSSTAEFMSS